MRSYTVHSELYKVKDSVRNKRNCDYTSLRHGFRPEWEPDTFGQSTFKLHSIIVIHGNIAVKLLTVVLFCPEIPYSHIHLHNPVQASYLLT